MFFVHLFVMSICCTLLSISCLLNCKMSLTVSCKEHRYVLCLMLNGRKKTNTWSGTVAGTLSTWCPTYFLSGMNDLKQSGWWKLADPSSPTIDICMLV